MIDDFDKEDYFESVPRERPRRPKAPKKPTLKPDDPEYYEEEESRWDHIIPAPFRRTRLVFYACGVILLFCFCWWFIAFFFTPVVDKADSYGYIENIRRHGTMFQTYEGTMIPYRTMKDTARVYDSDFNFSVKDAELATKLKYMERTGRPVRISYEVYRHRMPWRGQTKTVVLDVDTAVNPALLLPIDRRPEHP